MYRYFTILAVSLLLLACNKDDVIEQNPSLRLPEIHFYQDNVSYATVVGQVLEVVPEYENCRDASYEWVLDGVVISREPWLNYTWDKAGKYYVSITVTTSMGKASEEISVDVAEPGIPQISLPLKSDRVTVLAGVEYRIKADISNATIDGYAVEWLVNGVASGSTETLSFTPESTGTYSVTVKAKNAEGSSERSFTIETVEQLPIDISFAKPSYYATDNTRYTFAGRPVYLHPICESGSPTTWSWTVDGEDIQCHTNSFLFTPKQAGEYLVAVTADQNVTASVKVICVGATEEERYRAAGTTSSAEATTVFEWCPAPGQFIGDNSAAGGMMGNPSSPEAACTWALERLKAENFVSLGAFGGYIIVGFDHSIPAREATYDFSIRGNAFLNAVTGTGGSNEPGIVYVMQDVNGNGLPDDEWYELRGSEASDGNTWRDYAVTYYRPAGAAMNVQWTDNRGNAGTVKYLPSFHRQPYYYPSWISAQSYTLRGTRLAPRVSQDAVTGMWNSMPYAWGYADNMGSDLLDDSDVYSESGESNGFNIANAVYPDLSPVKLKYIDFIKVQTGVNASIGILGEVSTEVLGFTDLSIAR